jgi:hypothetical protein
LSDFPFSGQPVVDIAAILAAVGFVQVVCEGSDFVMCRPLAAVGMLAHHSFARKARFDIGECHDCMLLMFVSLFAPGSLG